MELYHLQEAAEKHIQWRFSNLTLQSMQQEQ
jgi:hypothetical protein